jgi:hypothetical protein
MVCTLVTTCHCVTQSTAVMWYSTLGAVLAVLVRAVNANEARAPLGRGRAAHAYGRGFDPIEFGDCDASRAVAGSERVSMVRSTCASSAVSALL